MIDPDPQRGGKARQFFLPIKKQGGGNNNEVGTLSTLFLFGQNKSNNLQGFPQPHIIGKAARL